MTPRPFASVAVVLACASLAACVSPTERVREGEALNAQGQHKEAARVFKDALNAPGLPPLDRITALVGEVSAFIGMRDWVGAEARLRRMDDTISAKSYYLGVVYEATQRPVEAVAAYQRALDQAHGGDTARRLARLIGGEARASAVLLDAADVLERGGDAQRAASLREAAAVWRGADAGDAPISLMKRLLPHKEPLDDFASVQVIWARLLDVAGETTRANKAWSLTDLRSPPSESYREFATALRARLAAQRGDEEALEQALTSAEPRAAARVRADLAASSTWQGDTARAADMHRKTAEAGGASAPLAWAALAQELDLLGSLAEARQAWELAEKGLGAKADPGLVLRVARHRVAGGDVIGASHLLAGLASDALDEEDQRLLAAGELLVVALERYAHGEAQETTSSAHAVRLLVPAEPCAQALLAAGKREARTDDVGGATLRSLRRALLVRALRAGRLVRAGELLASEPALRDSLDVEIHGGLRAALARGQTKQAEVFLDAHAGKLSSARLARLRACASLSALTGTALSGERGVLALPDGVFVGSLTVAKSGYHLGRVAISRRGGAFEVSLPGGSRLRFSDVGALATGLGAGQAEDVRWVEALDDDVEALEWGTRAGWATRRSSAAPLEVE